MQRRTNFRRPPPRAIAQVIVEEVAGEGLIYDLKLHRAHSLSARALAVFRLCDGRTSPSAIAARLSAGPLGAVELAAVQRTIAELDAARLLRPRPAALPDRERRRALGKLALTAGLSLAMPAVFSIVAPSVAEAASAISCVNAGACKNVGDCCGTPGSPARTCNGGLTCGNNASNSQCRGLVCK